MNACRCCGKKIQSDCLRCPGCNCAWHAGAAEGAKNEREKVRDVFKAVQYLLLGEQ